MARAWLAVLWMGLGVACVDEDPLVPDPDPPVPTRADHVFLMEVSPTEASDADLSFLAAIPASAKLNGGRPAVLALTDMDAMPDPTVDLLERMAATDAYVLNDTVTLDAVDTVHTLQADDSSQLSAQLTEHWTRSDYLVLADGAHYASAVLATSFAARLNAPVVFTATLPEGERARIEAELGVTETFWVDVSDARQSMANTTALHHTDDVFDWMNDHAEQVSYIALTNVADRTSGRAQKASLVASMFTARRGGLVVPLEVPMPTEAAEQGTTPLPIRVLHQRYASLGYVPEYLAIVGAHDALPQVKGQSIFGSGEMEHPVSDLPYGQVDADMFLDVAIGRIVSATIEEGSALATRTTTYEQLADGFWDTQFVESGLWGFDELRSMFRNVGFDAPMHPTEEQIENMGMIEAAAMLHKDHSNCMILGHAMDVRTEVLFAPAVVVSMGCSVAGMDQVFETQRTMVDHVLGSGAVAFMGASRNAIAENTYMHVAFWNELFEGRTIGEAYREGVNDFLVHWKDEGDSAALRYSIDIQLLFGDPALAFAVPGPPEVAPAQAERDGNTVTVLGPEAWTLVQFKEEQLAEWGYEEDLFMYVGPGATPRTYWSGRHDAEDLYYAVSVPLTAPFAGLTQNEDLPYPLGWRGDAYVDEQLDGSQRLRWRVRLLDYNMADGELYTQVDGVSYTLQ